LLNTTHTTLKPTSPRQAVRYQHCEQKYRSTQAAAEHHAIHCITIIHAEFADSICQMHCSSSSSRQKPSAEAAAKPNQYRTQPQVPAQPLKQGLSCSLRARQPPAAVGRQCRCITLSHIHLAAHGHQQVPYARRPADCQLAVRAQS